MGEAARPGTTDPTATHWTRRSVPKGQLSTGHHTHDRARSMSTLTQDHGKGQSACCFPFSALIVRFYWHQNFILPCGKKKKKWHKGFGFFWRVLCFYPETNTSFRTALSVNPSPAPGASYVIYVILGKALSACLQDSRWRPASILTVHAFSCWEQLSNWVFLTFWLSGEVNLSLRETLLRGGNCTSSAIALAGKGLTIETDKMLLWNHAQLHKYPEITACSGS